MEYPRSQCQKVNRVQTPFQYVANRRCQVPPKPKLVARAAGSEMSPWKIKKDAPKISAKDVPGTLRPLMSCALWRLHESIERNDPNQLFLLSNQSEIRSVAEKLNIITQSDEEVWTAIASKTIKTDLDTFGDLERDFDVQQKVVISPTQDIDEVNREHSVPDRVNGGALGDQGVIDNSTSSEGTANTEASRIVYEQGLEKQNLEQEEEKSSVNGDNLRNKITEQDVLGEAVATSVAEKVLEKPAKSVESIRSLVDSIIQQDFQKGLNGSLNGPEDNGIKSRVHLADLNALEHSATRSPPNAPFSQPPSMEPVQCLQEVQTFNDNFSSNDTTIPPPSILEATQEPEDSDEEVVVFIPQPKRFSAQQKPAQQTSRPSTPKDQPQQQAVGQSPHTSSAKPQRKGKAPRHSPNSSVVGHAHPQNVNSPTVIDPDAFGRDFRVSLNPSPRLPHHPNGHSSHRIRGNMQNTQGGQLTRNSPRQLARTSPPRNFPQENSRHLTPLPGPAPKDAPNNKGRASRASPRSISTGLKAEESTPLDVESEVITAATLPKSQHPGPQAAESFEFVPQTNSPDWSPPRSRGFPASSIFVPSSALSNVELQPGLPEPRIYEPNEFVPRPSRPVRESKPRTPRPKVFEVAEFVPRDFVPRAQSKQQLPEPESIEPRPSMNDVDYVLKSGSTRASARGRGRLWTPS